MKVEEKRGRKGGGEMAMADGERSKEREIRERSSSSLCTHARMGEGSTKEKKFPPLVRACMPA